MTVEELNDELEAINAIFPGSFEDIAPQIYNFHVLNHEEIPIQISFPQDYPEVKPEIIQIITSNSMKYNDLNYLEDQFNEILSRIFRKDEVCIFEFYTELQEFLESYDEKHKETMIPIQKEPISGSLSDLSLVDNDLPLKKQEVKSLPSGPDPLEGWIQSDPILDRNSTFIAFARKVESLEEAKSYLDLLTTDKKISRAAHNISSWRIRKENGVQYQDCDDDGETAAGGRLLHLLTMMDVWNVIVVVSRWFGGIHLGPDRFKHINSAARDAVVKGGFSNVNGDGNANANDNKKSNKKKK
ncbi:ribosomal protein S5 domain 2-type protein [Scheffersomyces coipomensis]|uniref:ribosomal protein S5 domain 2-type protein n=1 Tax=Scheffersomyces coipomensis TaxID=1788519 RepID=UPI00315C8C6F